MLCKVNPVFSVVDTHPQEPNHVFVSLGQMFSQIQKILPHSLTNRFGLEYTPRFPFQKANVVFQLIGRLSLSGEVLICDDSVLVANNLHSVGVALYRNGFPQKANRKGILISVEADCGIVSHRRRGNSGRLIAVWSNRMQTGLFCEIHIFDALRKPLDFMGVAVVQTACQKLLIQTVHGIHFGNWNQKTIPAVAYQILHLPFLIVNGHIAEVSGKYIMGGKHMVIILGHSMQAESFFGAHFAVVKKSRLRTPPKWSNIRCCASRKLSAF